MGSSLILESLSTSGIVPGLSGASFYACDSVLRTVVDAGKGFSLPFILTIVMVIVSSRGGSKKGKKWYLYNRTYCHPNEPDHFYKSSSMYRVR
jgi:hypothetical protein